MKSAFLKARWLRKAGTPEGEQASRPERRHVDEDGHLAQPRAVPSSRLPGFVGRPAAGTRSRKARDHSGAVATVRPPSATTILR